ncbi:MAG: hypothetical protein OEL56_03635 [Nitrosopumilus sp.]|nr:hypothetical protein [Nitrosopumilus sp.]MDH3489518.1 hypothetical protein [Nitrosopumilus sp.]MDH3516516.1 hypothetical protein [Nitrosopumilus sp.]MDH3564982.1 hypothetical protein [Nitrosopumilus sp.]MDH5416405.1 hypothetical protein [Nitrosopumilus sp.]
MKIYALFVALCVIVFLPQVHAEQTVSIIMEKTTYTYCEKLFYTIKVSEVTGNPAIIHIRDEAGKGSSAIPIQITGLENPIPSLIPFEKEVFPLGKYFIDVEYQNSKVTAEFELIDSDNTCIPELIKPIMSNWLSGNISDGFLMDAFERYVDNKLVSIPFEINESNVYSIKIPEWVKNIGYWWVEESITDDELSKAINYLVNRNIIEFPIETENEI